MGANPGGATRAIAPPEFVKRGYILPSPHMKMMKQPPPIKLGFLQDIFLALPASKSDLHLWSDHKCLISLGHIED